MDNNKILSETEEMYLVTIRRICEFCSNMPVPIPDVAKELGVQPVSASQMINKLAESGFLKYLPYKGVELTEAGLKVSTRILRHRRLWQVFLVKVLSMDIAEADTLACQIEHVTSREVANRLAKFLDNPKVCYHGDPIPVDEESAPLLPESITLESLSVGQTSQVMRINGDPAIIRFLTEEGLQAGIQISLLAVGDDGDLLLRTEKGHVHLSGEMAEFIMISSAFQNQLSRKERQMAIISLSSLSVGQKGVIQKLNFKGALRQRLLAMGLVTGETIQVKRIAPLGDPIDFVIKGYDLSLRKSEADDVQVTLLKEA